MRSAAGAGKGSCSRSRSPRTKRNGCSQTVAPFGEVRGLNEKEGVPTFAVTRGPPERQPPLDSIMSGNACVVGIDFGTDSVRSIVADATTGGALGTSVRNYPRWAKGLYCDPVANGSGNIRSTISKAWRHACERPSGRRERRRRPGGWRCGGHDRFHPGAGRPPANPWRSARVCREPERHVRSLERPHRGRRGRAAQPLARTWGGVDYTKYVGGIYSSEWFWAKAIHSSRPTPRWRGGGHLLEHCDWIPAVLTGTGDLTRFKRSRCAAGHKALWHAEFGGYPRTLSLPSSTPSSRR